METSWSFLLIGYNIIFEISSFPEKRVNLVSSNKRSSHPEVFSGKGVLKIFSKTTSMQKHKIYTHAKFTAEHSCRSTISIKLQSMGSSAWVFFCNFPAYFRTYFPKNASGGLLLK